jgi:tetratricopeptide (TPR) repeat protein
MKTNTLLGVLACCAILLLAGCQSMGVLKPPVDDLTPIKKARKEAAVRQFEEQRDFAEFKAAESAWDRGDIDVCRQTLETLLRRNPRHKDALLLLADACLENEQPEEATKHLEAALAAHPNDPGVHQAMGVLMDRLGRPENALAHYRQAGELAQGKPQQKPSAPRVLPAPGKTTHTSISGRNGSSESTAAADLNQRGEAALAAGKIDEAMACFRDAAAQNPNDPQIPIASAVAALRQNQPDVAIQLAEDALQRFPSSGPLLRLMGAAYYRKGDPESSELVLRQALSLDKSDALAYFLMSCTLTKLGQEEAAATHLRRARQLCPTLAGRPMAEISSR